MANKMEKDKGAVDERVDIEREYQVNSEGLITTPGKFEGEPLYVVYFWNMAMEDGGEETYTDEDGVDIDVFVICDNDTAIWPELAEVYAVGVWEDPALGFVNSRKYTAVELETELAQQDLEESED